MKKTCVICNESFQTAYPRKLTCSDDCGKIHHRIKANENRRKKQSKPKKAKEPTRSNIDKIAEKAVKAKEMGISYGKLVAMEQMEKDRNERLSRKK